MSEPAITLHGMKISGHTHRVELLLETLGLPYRYVETPGKDLASPEFRALNPLGQVPVLRDGDLTLADSNAILVYLVRRYAPDSQWLPSDAVGAARVQRWLSIAAGEIRYGPASARAIALLNRPQDPKPAIAIAERIFAFMEAELARGTAFLAADHPTIADLACYAYTARAPEGDVSLEPYPNLRAWLARVEALPRFKPMVWTREPRR
jgi:glutathione S-transferase